MLTAILAAAAETQPSALDALASVVRDNPLMTLLGLGCGVFAAGFAARKYFQDRELGRLKSEVQKLEEELDQAKRELLEIREEREEKESRLDRLADCVDPGNLKQELQKLLAHWPEDKQELVVVGLMRQLLETPGSAWLCTPDGSSHVKVTWDEQRGACLYSSASDSTVDPVKELRQFVTDSTALATLLLDLSAYGIVSVAKETGPNQVDVLKIRQQGMNWKTVTQTIGPIKR